VLETDELRIRIASVRLGAVSTLVLALLGLWYYADTWDAPNRPLMAALASSFALLAVLLLALPVGRVVDGRTGDAFFVGWSVASTLGIALFFHLDGGGRSPFAFGLVLALAFSGLLYPLRGAVGVAALVICSYLAVALAHPYRLTDVLFVAAALLSTSVMCVWTAWWRDRQRLELMRLSHTDPLTGSLNRRGLEQHVERAIAAGVPFAIVTLDLDGLKGVNDRDGHAAGDDLLRAAVSRLHEAVRPSDAVGRVGGDEFAIVLPGAGRDVAAGVLDRATLALSTSAPASFGLAAFPADGATSDALFRHADAAVYAAKARSRVRTG
jgi:diguanylate cyclase (GGDEF)-like protein